MYIYTTVQKFWISKTCDVFLKKSLMLIKIKNTLKKQESCKMLLQYKIMVSILIYLSIIYFCDAKLNFHQPLLQSKVSHDPYRNHYIMLIYYQCLKLLCCLILLFFGTCDTFFNTKYFFWKLQYFFFRIL